MDNIDEIMQECANYLVSDSLSEDISEWFEKLGFECLEVKDEVVDWDDKGLLVRTIFHILGNDLDFYVGYDLGWGRWEASEISHVIPIPSVEYATAKTYEHYCEND